jgi:ribonuclease Z
MPETTITFLGTAAAVPGAGEDSASYLINGHLQIDCGWYSALKMAHYGYSPLGVETLFFTHCHHDHYMGLPGLLFYRAMRGKREGRTAPLVIVGPADDLLVVVDLARRFLQSERFGFDAMQSGVELRPLEPGATFEDQRYRIETIRALHPVTGFCLRLTDKHSGVVLAFSGDTAPNPALAEHARGADLLIHEASVRPDLPDAQLRGDHSRAPDAAETARAAGVWRLRLVHLAGDHREASLAAARRIFPETELAAEGETLVLRR